MIETNLIGDKELMLAFSKAQDIVKDFRPSFEKLEDPVFLAIRKRIDAQGYPPLSPEYAKQKAKRHGSKPILRATDRLYGSFAKGAPGNVARIEALKAEFGTSVPYGMFHQTGIGRMPKRPVIDFTAQDEAQFTKAFVEPLNKKLRDLGFKVS